MKRARPHGGESTLKWKGRALMLREHPQMKGARPHVERAPLNERGAPSCRESTFKWKGPAWWEVWWFPPFLHAAKSWWPLDPLAVIHTIIEYSTPNLSQKTFRDQGSKCIIKQDSSLKSIHRCRVSAYPYEVSMQEPIFLYYQQYHSRIVVHQTS